MSISSRIRLWGSCIGKLFGTTLKGPFNVSAGGLAYLHSTPEGSPCSCNALAWPGWFLVFVTMGTTRALEEPRGKDGNWSISAWAPELLCTSERETRLTQDPKNNPMSFVGKEHPDQTMSEQPESRAKPEPCFPCIACSCPTSLEFRSPDKTSPQLHPLWRASREPHPGSGMGTCCHRQPEHPVSFHSDSSHLKHTLHAAASLTPWLTREPTPPSL